MPPAARLLSALLACALITGALGGCAHRHRAGSATTGSPADPALTIETVKMPPEARGEPELVYRIGPGDRLRINVFGEPGLDNVPVAIEADGTAQLPGVKPVTIQGLTLAQVRKKFERAYGELFKSPWVLVTIEEYGSHPLNLLGEFNAPGVTYMRGPTDVLTALALGKGTGQKAYLRGVRVIRDKQVVAADIYGVLREGKLDQNLWLKPNDTLFVPSTDDLKIYMLGAVKSPGAISLGNTPMTLLQALSAAGGATNGAKLSEVRIIRTRSPIEGDLIIADAQKMLAGEAPPITLEPDDIIYLTLTSFANWNQFIANVSPAILLSASVLQPFLLWKNLQIPTTAPTDTPTTTPGG